MYCTACVFVAWPLFVIVLFYTCITPSLSCLCLRVYCIFLYRFSWSPNMYLRWSLQLIVQFVVVMCTFLVLAAILSLCSCMMCCTWFVSTFLVLRSAYLAMPVASTRVWSCVLFQRSVTMYKLIRFAIRAEWVWMYLVCNCILMANN